ncbi:MAG: isoprenyl transferase [Phycisphaerales bacterium]
MAHEDRTDANGEAVGPIPRHIAIIMDGNGRWAKQRGLPRWEGHRAGAESVRRALRACQRHGVEALTLFSFSSENWRRPPEEVAALMHLLVESLRAERDQLIENNIRLRQIGCLDGLPDGARAELQATIDATSRCTGATLCLALNYGSRNEIARAVRSLARDAASGELDPESIDEAMVSSRLDTAGLPDPDLLVRTAGEMRISNFLLWQISYAEFHVTPTLWPDFGEADIDDAIRVFQRRERRFGAVTPAPAGARPGEPAR